MKISNKKFLRSGLVAAPDYKFTGEEPTWTNVVTKEDVITRLMKALNFYNYYLDRDDYIPIIAEFMKNHSYSKDEIACLKNIPKTNSDVNLIGKLARAYNMGMPKITNHFDLIHKHIKKLIFECMNNVTVVSTNATDTKPKVNPYQLLKDKVQKHILCELEGMLDEWSNGDVKVKAFNITNQLKAYNIPVNALGDVILWIEKQRDEFIEARDKICEEVVEGYSYLSKPAIKNRVNTLQSMLDDITLYKSSKNADRKPRVKKPKSADKQVAKIKYLDESKEFNVKSIDPIRVVGSSTLYVFNTKYKRLTVFKASTRNGFSVKGTTIEGFEKSESYCLTLRKPHDTLMAILGKTERQIDKHLAELKTKRKEPNGRINQDTILLKAQ